MSLNINMLFRIAFLVLISLSIQSCSDDEDEESCDPNITFEENIIGTWNYTIGFGPTGQVRINEDGTYEDLEGEFLSNGVIVSRTWRVESERMIFDVENGTLSLAWIDFDCDRVTFVALEFTPGRVFNREQ